MKVYLRFLIVTAAVLQLLVFRPSLVHSDGMHWFTEDLPPFNYLDNGKLSGIVPEVLAEITKLAGVPYDPAKVSILPWPRAYRHALATPGAAIFSMARTPEREGLFKWVGPICTVPLGMVVPKADGLSGKRRGRQDGIVVTTVRDSASEQLLLEQGWNPELLERTTCRTSSARMLAAGRVQAWAFCIPSALSTLRAIGLNPDDYESAGKLSEVDFYLAFNPGMDDGLVARLQSALESFRTTPRYRDILYDKRF